MSPRFLYKVLPQLLSCKEPLQRDVNLPHIIIGDRGNLLVSELAARGEASFASGRARKSDTALLACDDGAGVGEGGCDVIATCASDVHKFAVRGLHSTHNC